MTSANCLHGVSVVSGGWYTVPSSVTLAQQTLENCQPAGNTSETRRHTSSSGVPGMLVSSWTW